MRSTASPRPALTTAIVNVHHLADQIEAHLAARRAPKILISDEREKLLDQGGGIRKALPLLGDAPFFLCNTDAFWIEGPQPNLRRLAAGVGSEGDGHLAAGRRGGGERRRRLAGRLHHGPGGQAGAARGTQGRAFRLFGRRHHQARAFRRCARRCLQARALFLQRRARRAGFSACGSTASGCMSARRR